MIVVVAKLSSSRQLKFQLNWDNIITTCLPTPQPTPPQPNRNSSKLAFATFKDTRGLLSLSDNLEYEDDNKYEDKLKYEDNLQNEDQK